MKRIDHSTRLVDANGSGRDGFTEGTPGVTAATVVTDDWLNGVQEEIARAIELLGGTLDGNDLEQLGDLLVAALAGKIADPGTVTDNAVVRFDGTGGATVQNSGVAIDDSNNITGVAGLTMSGALSGATSLDVEGNITIDGELTYESGKARTIVIPALAFPPVSGVTHNSGGDATLSTNSVITRLALAPYFPDGAVINTIRAVVNPGIARATSGNRMFAQLIDVTGFSSGGSPAAGSGSGTPASPQRDDGTTNLQVITISSIAKTVDKTTSMLYVSVGAGNDAGVNNDTFHFIEIDWTDPGPRN